VSAYTFNDNWCVATVKHGSNDIEIMQVDSDKTIKQLAHIKGPAITEHNDVIGATALQTNNVRLQLVVAYKHDSVLRVYDTVAGQEVGQKILVAISLQICSLIHTAMQCSLQAHGYQVYTAGH
jgi:hypothetical protein